eukprot:jgi/Botrbrau1/23184/Bobra.0041s0034.2
MKHRIHLRKLGRKPSHRWSMLRTLASQLLQHERIETTLATAKELRRVADHVVTLGKQGNLSARQQAAAIIRGEDNLHKLFTSIADRYRDREGGYTRILQTRRRASDSAQMAYIEYIDRIGELRPARPPQKSLLPVSAQVVH